MDSALAAERQIRRFDPAPGATQYKIGRLLVHNQLAATARRLPYKAAIVTDERTVTYQQLDEMATRFANGLRALGANQGEVVALQLGNTIEHVALTYALGRAGLVCTPLSTRWTQAEVARCVEDAGVRIVIAEEGHTSVKEVYEAGSEEPLDLDIEETAPFHLRYTSGTTGMPKASLNTHRSLALFNMGTAIEFGVREEDVHLSMAPLTHAAIYFIHTVVLAGGTVILKAGFDPKTLWTDCDEHEVTSTLVVPTILAMAMDSPGEARTLTNVCSLGAPLATVLKERLFKRFPHVGLHEMYGATEFSMVSNLRPKDQLRKPRSVGQPRFGYEVGIFDDSGNPLPTGEVGSIYVRGLSTHVGYMGATQPEPAPEHLSSQGWVTVGDLGSLDEDGFLHISDRRSDLILSGGMNVYPSEVEDVLLRAPGVREVAVIGVSDEKWGKRVTACVVGDATADELDAYSRDHLAAYKIPRAYEFRSDLPKSPVGKILRRELVKEYDPSAE